MEFQKGVIQEVFIGNKGTEKEFGSLTIDGKKFSGRYKILETIRKLQPGDQVAYSYEINGQYHNLKSLSLLSSPAHTVVAGPATAQASAAPPSITVSRDESVLLSYAKDFIIAHEFTLSPQDAAKMVFDTLSAIRAEGGKSGVPPMAVEGAGQ